MQIKGELISKKNPRKAGKWEITDFVVSCGGKDVSCSLFGKVSDDLIGKFVMFDGSPRDFKGKTTYTVGKSGISEISAEDAVVTDAEIPATEVTVQLQPSREDCRNEAETSIINDFKSAQKIADEIKLKATPANLIEIANRVGTTITAISIGKK